MQALKIMITAACLPLCTGASAQQTGVKERSREIGLMADVNITSAQRHTSLYGIQYRYWKHDKRGNSTLGYRLVIGSGSHLAAGSDHYSSGSSNALYISRRDAWQNMIFIGGGIEAQRKFYKNIWLYAGVTATVGYGASGIDSVSQVYEHTGSGYQHSATLSYSTGSSGNGAFWAGLTPVLGIRAALGSRIWLGTEFCNYVTCSNAGSDSRGNRATDVSFDLGNINQRLYISYRF